MQCAGCCACVTGMSTCLPRFKLARQGALSVYGAAGHRNRGLWERLLAGTGAGRVMLDAFCGKLGISAWRCVILTGLKLTQLSIRDV